jgi:HrpA-like RNA helicase
MARFAIPEILRTPLESLFLQVKSMDQSTDVKTYLLYVLCLLNKRELTGPQESNRST